ncbi:MAG: murein hydrolase activator EnvC family protein, partial [Pseudomonadota bacterium]
GRLVTPFGTTDFLGQTVTGVEIAAPLWAQVRAPSAATIRYAGPVAGRGQGLILEPAPGRLLILAGLAGTLPGVGDIVLPGDPLGHLGVITPRSPEFLVEAPFDEGALSGGLLYMELRRDGVPIDPARRFALPQGRSETP